jgi:hypothetical protein
MFKIPALKAMNKCCLFQNNPTLLIIPYRIQSPISISISISVSVSVSLSILREFISALEWNAINITDTNHPEPQQLCEEFGFSAIAAKFSEFRPSMYFKEGKPETETDQISCSSRRS